MKKQIIPINSESATDEKPLAGYEELLKEIKARVRAAQVRAALAVNSELVLLY